MVMLCILSLRLTGWYLLHIKKKSRVVFCLESNTLRSHTVVAKLGLCWCLFVCLFVSRQMKWAHTVK